MHHATDFHREIVSEMGELGVLGPTIKGKQKQKYVIIHLSNIIQNICLKMDVFVLQYYEDLYVPSVCFYVLVLPTSSVHYNLFRHVWN